MPNPTFIGNRRPTKHALTLMVRKTAHLPKWHDVAFRTMSESSTSSAATVLWMATFFPMPRCHVPRKTKRFRLARPRSVSILSLSTFPIHKYPALTFPRSIHRLSVESPHRIYDAELSLALCIANAGRFTVWPSRHSTRSQPI